MTRAEYEQVQDTILNLIEKEKTYCAGYVANNPDDRKRREYLKDIIISGMDIVLSTLHAQVKTGRIRLE